MNGMKLMVYSRAIHYKKSPLCEFFTTKVGESSEPAEVVSAKSKAGGRK